MKGFRQRQLGAAIVLGISLLALHATSAGAAGLMKPAAGGDTDTLSIRSHDVRVVVNNGFARTEVDQVFFNRSSRDQEAIYTFPIPKQASRASRPHSCSRGYSRCDQYHIPAASAAEAIRAA